MGENAKANEFLVITLNIRERDAEKPLKIG
jgi:hypothetical protein